MVNQNLQVALEEMDRCRPVISQLAEYRVHYDVPEDLRQRNRVSFYEGEKTVFQSEIEALAIYYPQASLFVWTWARPSNRPSTSYLSRQLLKYCVENQDLSLQIRSLLTTGRSIIADATQIDICLALAISLIKKPYIYPQFVEENGVQAVYFLVLIDDAPLREWKD